LAVCHTSLTEINWWPFFREHHDILCTVTSALTTIFVFTLGLQ
jgi:hypothetical protein